MRGRAGPALAGGFERRWAGSTDIFKVLSNSCHDQRVTLMSLHLGVCNIEHGGLRPTKAKPGYG